MKPSDVPTDLLDAACDQMYGTPPDPGDDRAAVAFALAAVLPEHERQVRAKVADEILADAEKLIDQRVSPASWEAAFRAAYIARGGE